MDFFGNDLHDNNILDNDLHNLSDHFGSQMMIIGGDDLNKIH